jgi:hypothetical protein
LKSLIWGIEKGFPGVGLLFIIQSKYVVEPVPGLLSDIGGDGAAAILGFFVMGVVVRL